MVRAIEHPLVDVIGHPTGRMIGRREPYALDLERVVAAAADTGTFLEINANPNRRDLSEGHARMAAEAGVLLTVDSDAHGVERLGNAFYGIATARRGWLTPGNVANTLPWPELDALRRSGKRS
jgi:DNA polymerase (family 10)